MVFLMACSDLQENETLSIEEIEYPDSESWNAQMSFTKQGKRRAVLVAGYVAKFTKKNVTLLKEDIRVDFYDDDGNPKSYLTATEGKVFDKTKNMVAIGNVIVIARNGTHLYTEELHWNNETERILSDVPVMITTDTDTLYGDSFTSDPDLIEYEITNTRGTSDNTISIEE
jgi:LPS export ABC transporter protein LptC